MALTVHTIPAGDTQEQLDAEIAACTRCPDLRAYCAEVARVRKRAYADRQYHGAPVPSFGDLRARVLLVGLAPGAHGSNRTGRPFTGDASGEWLYRALHRAGFANQPHAIDRDDGLELRDAFITAALRCAPPQNKPTPLQRANCAPYLARELAILSQVEVIVTLGKIADDAVHGLLRSQATYVAPRAPFAHGAETRIVLSGGRPLTVLASYHPSRQNTNTGVLTEPMLDAIFARARALITN
jgi:uracil-DNA glycosylase family 4